MFGMKSFDVQKQTYHLSVIIRSSNLINRVKATAQSSVTCERDIDQLNVFQLIY